ncbi:MAG: hypothetical protein ACYC0H_19245, partial [Solirubrobacteraceae bacterium]
MRSRGVRILLSGLGFALAFAGSARAAAPIWTGASPTDANFSTAANWNGGVPPDSSVASLTFPVLSQTCQANYTNSASCYVPNDNMPNLTAGSVSLDTPTGPSYAITGTDPLTIGAGGLQLTSGALTTISTPIALGASQKWTINGSLYLSGGVAGAGSSLELAMV